MMKFRLDVLKEIFIKNFTCNRWIIGMNSFDLKRKHRLLFECVFHFVVVYTNSSKALWNAFRTELEIKKVS